MSVYGHFVLVGEVVQMGQFRSDTNLVVPNEVACHLSQGEEALWVGRPRQGVVIRTIDYAIIPFSILAFCFFGLWSYIMLVKPVPLAMKILSFPAMGFAFYLLYGRFLLDARRRAEVYYAITTQRSLIIGGRNSSVLASFSHQDQQFDAFNTRTVSFGKPNGLAHMYVRAMGIGQYNSSSPEFELIPDAGDAQQILLEILATLKDKDRYVDSNTAVPRISIDDGYNNPYEPPRTAADS